jgi:hypothetical protein
LRGLAATFTELQLNVDSWAYNQLCRVFSVNCSQRLLSPISL